MPNYVRNIIKMKGIATLPLFTEGKNFPGKMEPEFDFNKIIPMPEALNMEAGSLEDLAIEAVIRKVSATERLFERSKATPVMGNVEYRQLLNKFGKTEEELCEMGLLYISNKIHYGATTWYDWCCKNWGTKWNTCNTQQPDTDTVIFDTAWAPPKPVIAQLSKMYPTLEIEHWWADEDKGYGDGYARYRNGKAEEIINYEGGSSEAYAAYVFCWGESACLYQDKNGQWHHRDCENCHGCD